MEELIVKIPGSKHDKKFIEELRRDIDCVVRLRVARELLLEKWDELLSESEFTEEDSIRLGREVNKASLDKWKGSGA